MADHPHTIDRWDDATGENLIEQIAAVGDYLVALETYRAAVKRWPKAQDHTTQPGTGDRAKLAGLAQSSACQHVHARPSNRPEPDTERRSKPKDTPAKLAKRMKRRWRIVLIRSKGEVLGTVEATDAQAAEKVAAIQFELDRFQRRRLLVQELAQ